jgi:hypothetical protein
MDPAGTAWTSIAGDFPTDISILRADSRIVFADGVRARAQTGVYTHHLGFVNIMNKLPEITRCNSRDSELPGRMDIFIGSAEETSPGLYKIPSADKKSAYHLKKGSPILITVDVVNYTNDEKVVYVEADIDYVEGKLPETSETSVQTWRLAECQKDDYLVVDIPAGQNKFTLSSKNMTVLTSGYIFNGSKLGYYLYIGLHPNSHSFPQGDIFMVCTTEASEKVYHLLTSVDGGVDLAVRVNGQVPCRSTAVYGVNEVVGTESGNWTTIKEMTYCTTPIKVVKGDAVVVEANYDFDLHPRYV